MKANGWAALLALLVLGTPLGARADEPRVVVVDPPSSTCVAQGELVDALSRAGVDAAPYALESSPANEPQLREQQRARYAAGHIIITLAGDPSALRVTVEQDGEAPTHTLPPAACETATDATAAFLASALGPTLTPSIPVDETELRRALGDELARRGVQLAMLGVKMDVTQAGSGSWVAELEYSGAPGCRQRALLGSIEAITESTVVVAVDVIRGALHGGQACRSVRLEEAEPRRAKVMPEPARVKAMHDVLGRLPDGEILAVSNVVQSVNFAFLTWLDTPRRPRAKGSDLVLQVAGSTMLVAGGAGTLFMNADHRPAAAKMTFLLGYGAFAAGGMFYGRAFSKRSTAAGFFYGAALESVNLFGRRRPLGRARRARKELEQKYPSVEQARHIERDIAELDPLVPKWLVMFPVVLGAAVGTVPMWRREPDDKDSMMLVADGAFIAMSGAVMTVDLVVGSIRGSYRRALARAGLRELSFGPGPRGLGLSLAGRF